MGSTLNLRCNRDQMTMQAAISICMRLISIYVIRDLKYQDPKDPSHMRSTFNEYEGSGFDRYLWHWSPFTWFVCHSYVIRTRDLKYQDPKDPTHMHSPLNDYKGSGFDRYLWHWSPFTWFVCHSYVIRIPDLKYQDPKNPPHMHSPLNDHKGSGLDHYLRDWFYSCDSYTWP